MFVVRREEYCRTTKHTLQEWLVRRSVGIDAPARGVQVRDQFWEVRRSTIYSCFRPTRSLLCRWLKLLANHESSLVSTRFSGMPSWPFLPQYRSLLGERVLAAGNRL